MIRLILAMTETETSSMKNNEIKLLLNIIQEEGTSVHLETLIQDYDHFHHFLHQILTLLISLLELNIHNVNSKKP